MLHQGRIRRWFLVVGNRLAGSSRMLLQNDHPVLVLCLAGKGSAPLCVQVSFNISFDVIRSLPVALAIVFPIFQFTVSQRFKQVLLCFFKLAFQVLDVRVEQDWAEELES